MGKKLPLYYIWPSWVELYLWVIVYCKKLHIICINVKKKNGK